MGERSFQSNTKSCPFSRRMAAFSSEEREGRPVSIRQRSMMLGAAPPSDVSCQGTNGCVVGICNVLASGKRNMSTIAVRPGGCLQEDGGKAMSEDKLVQQTCEEIVFSGHFTCAQQRLVKACSTGQPHQNSPSLFLYSTTLHAAFEHMLCGLAPFVITHSGSCGVEGPVNH
jgi:hypothetical protein